MPTSSTRKPYRLVDLVVALAVLALLVSMWLPMVLHVREASRRIASTNNLKAIALATINCAEFHEGVLPRPDDAGYPYEKGELTADGTPRITGYGPPFFHIIPYIECNSYYHDSYSDEDHLYSSKRLRGTPLLIYQAPDDPTRDKTGDSCSYAVNELAFAPPNGKAFRHYPFDFPDGTSNTILFAEQYARQYGSWGTGWTEPRTFRPYTEENGERIPKDPPFQNRPTVGRDAFDSERPQSFRYGGPLVATASWDVRVIGAQVTDKTFYDACTPDGGVPLDSDW
jgi:Protein of unknown function (DUF1559)